MMHIVNKQQDKENKENKPSLVSQAMEKRTTLKNSETPTTSASTWNQYDLELPTHEEQIHHQHASKPFHPQELITESITKQEKMHTLDKSEAPEKPAAPEIKVESRTSDWHKRKSIQDLATEQNKLKTSPSYQPVKEKPKPAKLTQKKVIEEKTLVPASTTVISPAHPTTQLLLSSKILIHKPEAGLNPIVDAAAHLFSVMGKLRHYKSYDNLKKLHAELIEDIETFLITIQTYNYDQQYLAEYILITRYALCVTLDDIILSTPWGSLGKWDSYSLIKSFEQEPLSHQNFLIILERLIRDPDIYIDLMEFMYICLSLGFKCRYNSSEFDHQQLEQINDALYKRIRSYRGNFSKILSPYSLRTTTQTVAVSPKTKKPWLMLTTAAITSVVLLFGGKYLLDNTFHHVNQSLAQTELVSYAKNTQSV